MLGDFSQLTLLASEGDFVRCEPFALVLFPMSREGNISPCAIMLGLLYIQRLSARNPAFTRSLSSKELFLASMVSSAVQAVALGNYSLMTCMHQYSVLVDVAFIVNDITLWLLQCNLYMSNTPVSQNWPLQRGGCVIDVDCSVFVH